MVQIWVIYFSFQNKNGKYITSKSFFLVNNSELLKRLLLFIDYIGSNPTDFSNKIGMSRAYIRTLKDEISTKALRNIIRIFPLLNIYWLIDGKGEMIISDDSKIINNENLTFHLKEEIKEMKEEIKELRNNNISLIEENSSLKTKLELYHGYDSSKAG